MVKSISNIELFKIEVRNSIANLSNSSPSFARLINSLLEEGGLFLIGGYLRNVANNTADSRDIDLISTLSTNDIVKIINEIGLIFSINRMEGIKVVCDSIKIDVWSIQKNWSFSKDRVRWDFNTKYRSDILVKKIADGSFFNFDSLVLDLKNYNCSVSNYNDFVERGILDILRKRGRYKYQNPTREANILRAFFISKKYSVELSDNTKTYIINELNNIETLKSKNPIELILKKSYEYKEKYKATISETELRTFLSSLKKDSGPLFELND